MKVLKHEWFAKIRDLVSMVNSVGIKPDDIAYLDKNPDGTWEILYFSKDDGRK